ncbi:ATPase family AAA domain-containing protein FIGL1 [Colletotrichum fructicola]|nr:ATPase family AAA domain-containing protein FIGL1 [Colletotrichum fructicola]
MYPLRFDRTGKFEAALRRSGQKIWSCRVRRFVAYNAPSPQFEIRASNPRYMIDMEMYKNLHSDDEKHEDSPKSIRTLAFEIMCRDEPPSDSFLLLLPPTVPGFGMHDKKWRILQVEHISAIEWNKNAFEQLVLDYNHRELIEAVIRGHMSSNMSPDIVEGKGKGVIILLHGGPGTGKTLTAESVAELAEKPLYRVTCGDIGTDPEKVEKYLESVLFIGSAWQAVVLLDESDVFLEEREKMDLKRNALVSVFLRVLEYYEGILILTSNRVGHFDEAFKSRMQLTLHYPPRGGVCSVNSITT